jgi:hypothetical protein
VANYEVVSFLKLNLEPVVAATFAAVGLEMRIQNGYGSKHNIASLMWVIAIGFKYSQDQLL